MRKRKKPRRTKTNSKILLARNLGRSRNQTGKQKRSNRKKISKILSSVKSQKILRGANLKLKGLKDINRNSRSTGLRSNLSFQSSSCASWTGISMTQRTLTRKRAPVAKCSGVSRSTQLRLRLLTISFRKCRSTIHFRRRRLKTWRCGRKTLNRVQLMRSRRYKNQIFRCLRATYSSTLGRLTQSTGCGKERRSRPLRSMTT